MCQQSIRRLTPDEIDAREDRHQAVYERLYARVEDEMREDHDREFGPLVKFKADGRRVHAKVEAMMREMGEE